MHRKNEFALVFAGFIEVIRVKMQTSLIEYLIEYIMIYFSFRSKSRSVDHGLASPFDLDSLKSKVESRFESIDRLSKGTMNINIYEQLI